MKSWVFWIVLLILILYPTSYYGFKIVGVIQIEKTKYSVPLASSGTGAVGGVSEKYVCSFGPAPQWLGNLMLHFYSPMLWFDEPE